MRYFNRTIFTKIRNIIKYYNFNRIDFLDYQQLIEKHYETWSEIHHHTRHGLEIGISKLGNRPAMILETGTSAWGCDSSRLFDQYVRNFGGDFISVDLRAEASEWLKYEVSPRSKFYVGDSVSFLNLEFSKMEHHKIDLCYLDSFDLDWNDPLPSANHGYLEFVSIKEFLKKGSILIIDDSPSDLSYIPEEFHKIAMEFYKNFGVFPGKGSFIQKEIINASNASILYHGWNLVIQF